MNKNKKHLVVLSGAGISAESGLATFRDSDGLWEQYRIEDVCTPEAWQRNPKLVLEFYNLRRKQAAQAQPNKAHQALAKLEEAFDITVITQNVDDLHERAGSTNVLHLHGQLNKSRSSQTESLTYDCPDDLNIGDVCEEGHQLRPHIVFFGEMVPAIEKAAQVVEQADILLVIGTSLQVYPAAGLVSVAPRYAPVYVIDPKAAELQVSRPNLKTISKTATEGIDVFIKLLFEE